MRTVFYLAMAALCVAALARAEETITLTDGRTVSGTILAEDEQTVVLRTADGEQRAILKSRIAAIAKPTPVKAPASVAAPQSKAPGTMPPAVPPTPAVAQSNTAQRAAVVKELGSPQPERRSRAAQTILDERISYLSVMLAMLHPKQPTDEYTRIGILRLLKDCGPLDDAGGATLGFAALYDPYPEARREACVTIKALSDDRAVREMMKAANTQNPALRHALAAAIHEIDDPRVLMALIRALPQPSVTSDNQEASGLDKPAYQLPTGPGGVSIPIFLPSGGVSGIATDLDSPAVPLLKQIAGKDLGNLPYGWFNWYREKLGEIGKEERDALYERRSIRDRMNR